ncbi:protein-(glutamine-N5) methyltransferase, release factor-specific [Salinivibrio sp. MA351]|jgi:release factor glutamine methyltransferase|uniref:peptide chain release factor N(5)-glutamine methyltransferase n=1 Tax=Salinivibrio TaxID=51366 RepID=UPI000987B6B6|nr:MULTISPECIES: peptide chain release factor N(5)-glutamine methyltransferase [unclassified Salinivibrio]OOE95992.1 protein-(glutamine-N5) methyltransferase, release factor-specific [Salinivibrio sp. AR640]OOE97005.1 protein-(glutamine-N5) methyltransferase, release factor-specific [Salinivibrio sp. IB643]OOE99534.1 protein-(glutamine-N5) methyltransferase, release factor-specific [Salinivibrio sp. MA351]OOF03424.1 protein-(glutamine-N5) methyltransferase, release factor-specific [Salinivibrio
MTVTIGALLADSTTELTALSGGSAGIDVKALLCHVLAQPTSYLYTWPERKLTAAQLAQFRQLFARRLQGEPIAYILGYRDFWTLRLNVSPATLIPRPETELLVEQALALLPATPCRVLDLGTGTGAVALAIASERPDITVVGVDLMPEAVMLASRNADAHQINNVHFIQSDWFKALSDMHRFDLIVSNPPYIDETDPHLQQGDVRFEPMSALVAEDSGLADIRYIGQSAPDYLAASGWLMVEHGYNQGEAVRRVWKEAGWHNLQTQQDYAGLDRITLAQRR